MTVLMLHGITGKAGIHWQQWLCDQLVEKGIKVLMPTLPNANRPDRQTWLLTVQDLVAEVQLSSLIIVGHSLGVATALDFIEAADSKIKGLISVAGFDQDYGSDLNSYFMKEKAIDFNKVNQRLDKSFVIYGNDDPYVPQEILRLLAQRLGVDPIIISQGGHLNTKSGYTTFPLLFEIITEKI